MDSARTDNQVDKSPVGTTRGLLARLGTCRSGATAIEYGLICSLIFLVIVTGVRGVATNTMAMHLKIQNATQ